MSLRGREDAASVQARSEDRARTTHRHASDNPREVLDVDQRQRDGDQRRAAPGKRRALRLLVKPNSRTAEAQPRACLCNVRTTVEHT